MKPITYGRRTVLSGMAALPFALYSGLAKAQITVPWSSGTEMPKTHAPAGAVDTHHHIYDSRYPVSPKATLRPADATVADYRKLQQRIGTVRHVVVQPSTYGTDNSCLLDALAAFGKEARGIAVVDATVSDRELQKLNDAGVRGVRFNFSQPGAPSATDIEPLAHRLHALGWHIQVNAFPDKMMEIKDVLMRLPTPVVFDHVGRLRTPEPLKHPAFTVIANMLQDGRAWMKLSGAYLDGKVGPPGYDDVSAVAKAFVRLAPTRLVWGSDWPHPSAKVKPDDALLFDLLATWTPDEATRKSILVDNPVALYGF